MHYFNSTNALTMYKPKTYFIMDNKKFIEELNSLIEGVKLSEKNKKFINIIQDPNSYDFDHSHPGKYNSPSPQNEGETAWQRELYKMESDIWLDLELPIGQYKSSKQFTSLRIDLIGKKDDRFILCELKKTKNAGQPFDAILQLIAYHVLLQNNYKKLDEQNIHHTNCNSSNWKWEDVKNTHVLWLRANNEYWNNWHKCTKKNGAARKIVELCCKYNIVLQLFCDDHEICICERVG